MKTKNGFRLRELGGDYILIGESMKLVNFDNLVTFNDSAAYLWRNVEGKEFTLDTLTQLLMEEYEVDAPTAKHDAQHTLNCWIQAGIIE